MCTLCKLSRLATSPELLSLSKERAVVELQVKRLENMQESCTSSLIEMGGPKLFVGLCVSLCLLGWFGRVLSMVCQMPCQLLMVQSSCQLGNAVFSLIELLFLLFDDSACSLFCVVVGSGVLSRGLKKRETRENTTASLQERRELTSVLREKRRFDGGHTPRCASDEMFTY